MLDGSSAIVDITNLKEGVNSVDGFTVISDYEDFGHYHPMKCYLTVKNGPNFMYDYTEFDYWIDFPRYFPLEVCTLYVTPNNPIIRDLASNISSWPKWLTIVNWVASNIDYPSEDADGDGKPDYDYIKHGKRDYWQLPIETLNLRTGDCEDYAILYCSLLRASGYDENSVFVMVGHTNELGKIFYGDSWHAWVRVNLGGIWTDIEPQDPTGIIASFLIDFAMFEGVYRFNAVYFENIK